MSSAFCACNCDSAGPGSCEEGLTQGRKPGFFSNSAISLPPHTQLKSFPLPAESRICFSLLLALQSRLIAGEEGEVLCDLIGEYPPKVQRCPGSPMAARTGWVSLQELGELCGLEGARTFAGENKGTKLLQELGQGWGVPGSPAATGTAWSLSAGHKSQPSTG